MKLFSGLHRKIHGFPQLSSIFFLYLSVELKVFCEPKSGFLAGTYWYSMSSSTKYSAEGFQLSIFHMLFI